MARNRMMGGRLISTTALWQQLENRRVVAKWLLRAGPFGLNYNVYNTVSQNVKMNVFQRITPNVQ